MVCSTPTRAANLEVMAGQTHWTWVSRTCSQQSDEGLWPNMTALHALTRSCCFSLHWVGLMPPLEVGTSEAPTTTTSTITTIPACHELAIIRSSLSLYSFLAFSAFVGVP
ncbi:Uncharacterized protein TCM_033395 isoform 2 [Theobroma cacao]|nr:Uncharacterized protein TCM_033395 isoform 2 [Theobroma cacao]EOY14126.1 Uncharacterized protein TCM_033395 isoform 2 [Theobroma cacao]